MTAFVDREWPHLREAIDECIEHALNREGAYRTSQALLSETIHRLGLDKGRPVEDLPRSLLDGFHLVRRFSEEETWALLARIKLAT